MNIAHGHQGTLETLRIMRHLAQDAADDPAFRQWVWQRFTTADSANQKLRSQFRYVDEEVETLRTPLSQWMRGELIGDCDDIAMFYMAVFMALQIPSRLIAIRTRKNEPDYLHVFVEAFEHGNWKRYDPTVLPGTVEISYGDDMIEYA